MAKSYKDDEPEKAIVELKKIIDSSGGSDDTEDKEWIFKSYKQLIKLYLAEDKFDDVLTTMELILPILPLLLNHKSYIEESLSRMIVRFANVPNLDFVNQVYQLLLDQEYFHNDKLWLKVNANLLGLYLETGELDKIPHLLRIIYDKLPQIPESIRKLFTLEIIAGEIEYLFKLKGGKEGEEEEGLLDIPKLTNLYKQSSKFTTAVTHPKILGVLSECGARVQFFREDYDQARAQFYESFKNYDEAGAIAKNKILKYLALCSLLCNHDLDPFQSQETQSYAQFAEFDNLKRLIKAYKDMSVIEFMQVLLLQLDDEFFQDEIFKQAIVQIMENLRIRVLMKTIGDCTGTNTELTFQELYQVLQVDDEDEFGRLLLKLTGTGRLIDAKVDFENQLIIRECASSSLLVPTTAKEIYYNVKLLDTLTTPPPQDADSMVIEETSLLFSGSNHHQSPSSQELNLLSRMFFVIDRPKKPQDWFKSIECWYLYVLSFLPKTRYLEISQHEQVLDEIERSKLHSQGDKSNNKSSLAVANELANFNTGLLNLTMQDAYGGNGNGGGGGEDDDEDMETIEVKRVNLLQSWVNALKN